MKLFKKNLFLPPSKNSNYNFLQWSEIGTPEVKKICSSLNNLDVSKMFKNKLYFDNESIKAKYEFGSSFFNKYTINHIIKCISIFLKKKGINDIFLLMNNYENLFFASNIITTFETYEITVHSYEDLIQPIGLLSYTVNRRKNCYGMYISGSKQKKLEMTLVDNEGQVLSVEKYLEINEILDKTQMLFLDTDFEKQNLNIKLENPLLIENYYNFLLKDRQMILLKENIVIIAYSDAIEKMLLRINDQLNLKMEIVKVETSKKSSDDLNYPTAFSPGYKIANKIKSSVMIAFDDKGQRFSIACKQNRVWKFLSSLEMGILLFYLNGRNSKLETSTLIPKFIRKLSKEKSSKKTFIDLNFKYLVNDMSYYDSFKLLLYFLEKIFLNKVSIIFEKLKLFEEDIGYCYDEKQTSEITEEKLNFFISNAKKKLKLDEITINNFTREIDNNFILVLRMVVPNGEIILDFNKSINRLTYYFYSFNHNFTKAFSQRKELLTVIPAFVTNQRKTNTIDSKKGRRRIMFFFVLFLVAIVLVFSYVFKWEEIAQAITIVFSKANTTFFFALILNLVLFPVFSSTIYYWIIKQVKKDTRYIQLYWAFVFVTFINLISPILIITFSSLVWYLKRYGYKTSEIIPATSIELFLYVINTIIVGVTFIPYGFNYLSSIGLLTPLFMFATIFGFFWIVGWIFLTFIFSYSKSAQFLIFAFIEKTLFFVKKEKFYKSIYNTIFFNTTSIRFNTKQMMKDWFSLIAFVLVSLLSYFYHANLFFSSVAIVDENYINSSTDSVVQIFFNLSSVNTLVSYSVAFIPIPGGIGAVDIIITTMLTEILGNPESAAQASFIYRFFTYYGIAFVTLFPFSYNVFIKNLKTNKSRNIWDT